MNEISTAAHMRRHRGSTVEPALTKVCHKCGSGRVQRSRRRGIGERIVALAGLRFCRCRDCNARFATFGGSVLLGSDVNQAVRRVGIGLLLVAALLLVIAGVLWFSGKQAAFSSAEHANVPQDFHSFGRVSA